MRLVASALALSIVAACSAEPSLVDPGAGDGDLAEPRRPARPGLLDASTPDASGEAPLLRATFEPASAACNDWTTDGPVLAIRSVPPHSGDYACRICGAGDIALSRVVSPVEAGRYVMSVWLRRRPGRVSPAQATLSLDAETLRGAASAATVAPVGDAYLRAEVAIALPDGATSLTARVSIASEHDASVESEQGGDGACLLLDDVIIERSSGG